MNANQCSITVIDFFFFFWDAGRALLDVIEFYLKNALSGLPGGPGAKTPYSQ